MNQFASTLDTGEIFLCWCCRNGEPSGEDIISPLVFFFIPHVYFPAFVAIESCLESEKAPFFIYLKKTGI